MSEEIASFRVHGEAKGAGSKSAFVPTRKDGSIVRRANGKPKVVVRDMSREAGTSWRAAVADEAKKHFVDELSGEVRLIEGAVEVEIVFYRHRPKGHYGSGRNSRYVKDSAPAYPTTRPDVDKTSRAILDALKGIAWNDDAQVTKKTVEKRFAESDYTDIKILRPATQFACDLPIEQRVRGLPLGGERPAEQESLLAVAA